MKRHASDPHDVLGIQRNATSDEVRAAYRTLAKRFHPDVNPDDPGAEERFKEIQWAYEEICDVKERLKVPPAFSGSRPARGLAYHDEHPFLSFLEAVRAYYARKREG